MMDIRRITDDFSVSPQIAVADLQTIWDAGFRTVICNRPDNEEPGQPSVAETEAAAREIGFAFAHIPADSVTLGMAHADETRRVLTEVPAPVFAYCRSGTRCTVIWSLMMSSELAPNEILAATAAAGYDMSPVIDAD